MKPVIGITMGDPASIGPELCIKALSYQKIYEKCSPIVIGDANILRKALDIPGMPTVNIHAVQHVSDAYFRFGTIDVLDMNLCTYDKMIPGEISVSTGEASFQYVVKAIELASANHIDATVTNAINKEAVNLAGHHFAGHTEIYAHYTNTNDYTMLLAHEGMRIVHVSTHVSLREACDRVKKERVLKVIRIANQACKDLGIARPMVGVAGLNPHCGEGGLFGREEIEEIMPAIEQARTEGILVDGPVPPDTIFSKARGGWYDIVVAMYHDQGHIPLKVLGFVYNKGMRKWESVSGVNITLGLSIIRTSVDHGTAFDQAWKGTATADSLINAIEYAQLLAINRK